MATSKKYPRRKPPRAGARKGRFWPRARLFLIAAGVLVALGFFYRGPVVQQARLGAAYAAKSGCSCRYVDGREGGSCRSDFEPGMELVMVSADDDAKSVTARVPGLASETARWRRGWGCMLDPWND